MKPAKLAAILLSVLVSAAFFELIGVWAAIILAAGLLLGIIDVDGMALVKYSYFRISHRVLPAAGSFNTDYSTFSLGSTVFVRSGSTVYLPFSLKTHNLVGLSLRARIRAHEGIREMLNGIGCDFSVIVAPVELHAGEISDALPADYGHFVRTAYEGCTYFRPYIFLSRKTGGARGSENALLDELGKTAGYLESAGIGIQLPSESEIRGILDLKGARQSPDSGSSEIRYSTGRQYFSLDKGYFMSLRITDFKNGPAHLLSQAIDSVDFFCYINMNVRMYENSRARKVLKYMISERSTDLKIQKGKSSARNNSAERQLGELNFFLRSIDDGGDRLADTSCTILIRADDPPGLTGRFHRISAMLDFLGLQYRISGYFTKNRVRELLPLRSWGGKYMTNSSNLSRVLPLFFTADKTEGLVIGLNSTTDKPELFSFFGKNSYNVMILGETGSGKSHFSKMLLRRALMTGFVKRVLLIDPLDEYSPSLFGGDGNILNLSGGDYFEIPYGSNVGLLEYLVAVIEGLIHVKEEDKVTLRSVVSVCIKDSNPSLAEIFSVLSERMPEYSDEIDYAERTHFRNPVNLDSGLSKVNIIRFSARESLGREIQLLQIVAYAYMWMSQDADEKAILIDEAHLFVGNDSVTRVVDSLVRNSRHFNTSVINVTQNFSDFRRTEFSSNIINNTSEYFVFRNKTDSREFHDLFGDMVPKSEFVANLKGGKGDRYSECVRIRSSKAYPIRIITTREEMDAFTGQAGEEKNQASF